MGTEPRGKQRCRRQRAFPCRDVTGLVLRLEPDATSCEAGGERRVGEQSARGRCVSVRVGWRRPCPCASPRAPALPKVGGPAPQPSARRRLALSVGPLPPSVPWPLQRPAHHLFTASPTQQWRRHRLVLVGTCFSFPGAPGTTGNLSPKDRERPRFPLHTHSFRTRVGRPHSADLRRLVLVHGGYDPT